MSSVELNQVIQVQLTCFLNVTNMWLHQYIAKHLLILDIKSIWSIRACGVVGCFLQFQSENREDYQDRRIIRGQGHSTEYDGPSTDLLTDLDKCPVCGSNAFASQLMCRCCVSVRLPWPVCPCVYTCACDPCTSRSKTVIGSRTVHGERPVIVLVVDTYFRHQMTITAGEFCSHPFPSSIRFSWPATCLSIGLILVSRVDFLTRVSEAATQIDFLIRKLIFHILMIFNIFYYKNIYCLS